MIEDCAHRAPKTPQELENSSKRNTVHIYDAFLVMWRIKSLFPFTYDNRIKAKVIGSFPRALVYYGDAY